MVTAFGMSNDIPARENELQAENSNEDNLKKTIAEDEKMDFTTMSVEELNKFIDSAINDWKSMFPDKKIIELLLSYEAAGFPPSKMEKHHLKAEYPDIKFETVEWQEWVSDPNNADFPNCDRIQ